MHMCDKSQSQYSSTPAISFVVVEELIAEDFVCGFSIFIHSFIRTRFIHYGHINTK
jgi:hypothetical protein